MRRTQPLASNLVRDAVSRSFLHDVTPSTAESLLRNAVVHRLRAGELFMVQSEEHRCGVVVGGMMRVFVALADGHERTLREVLPGGAVGVAAFSGLPNAVNVQAVVDSYLLDLDPEQLTVAAESDSSLAIALLREVSLRLRDTEQVMAAELGPVRQRLARRLLDSAA